MDIRYILFSSHVFMRIKYMNRDVADELGESILLLYQCESGVFTTVMKIVLV